MFVQLVHTTGYTKNK